MTSNNNLLKKSVTNNLVTDTRKKNMSVESNSTVNTIAEHFIQFLQPRIAVEQVLKEEVFKIRHSVYCEELAFEKTSKSGQETDVFDQHSIFSLIQHKPSGEFTSCVRLVTSSNLDELLPIEKFCSASITRQDLHPKNFNRLEIGELSRLAVKSNFRRRNVDDFQGSATGVISETNYSERELRCFPFITIGLYMSAAIMCSKHDIRHIYVMMEPRLARSVKFIGINFLQLGPAIEYHGLRAPYYIEPKNFTQNLSTDFKKLYKIIEKDISLQLSKVD